MLLESDSVIQAPGPWKHREVFANGARFHIVEAGEGPLHPSIPAIANAIYDAIGVRMTRLPFSAPSVWKKIAEARTADTLRKPLVPAGDGTLTDNPARTAPAGAR